MDFDNSTIRYNERLEVKNYLPEMGKDQLAEKIWAGLQSKPKSIPSMFFYDTEGSKIYERITELPEYYPPQVEKSLIPFAADALAEHLVGSDVIELGSGDCSKISIFLDHVPTETLQGLRYIPVDFSLSAIVDSAYCLQSRYSDIDIMGVVGDFLSHLSFLPKDKRKLFIFFGSTIGNLERHDALSFCEQLAQSMSPDDLFLMGFDMVKDRDVLNKAYNDGEGVTAEFNRNIINVVNSLLGTDLDPMAFEHVAFFNESESRIEMHLKALNDLVTITSDGRRLQIEEGEMIHTENSYKFTLDGMKDMVEDSGLMLERVFSDDKGWFSLGIFRKKR